MQAKLLTVLLFVSNLLDYVRFHGNDIPKNICWKLLFKLWLLLHAVEYKFRWFVADFVGLVLVVVLVVKTKPPPNDKPLFVKQTSDNGVLNETNLSPAITFPQTL
jgi:hypothetical protein